MQRSALIAAAVGVASIASPSCHQATDVPEAEAGTPTMAGSGGAPSTVDSGGEAGSSGGRGGSSGTGGSSASLGGAGGISSGAGGTVIADATVDVGSGDVASEGGTGPTVVQTIDVTDVWSGHPVFFSLVTQGNQQFAAFYDANRQMTVATRNLASTTWSFARLPTTLGWDSHNYVTMTLDSGGFLHVSGNMHAVPLIYFRSGSALDITTFAQVPAMIGANEASCTYPQFFQGPTGGLVFAYRDGSSGNGNYIFNTYDVANRAWSRLINTPLLDGQGLYSAYPVGPILGPDGFYHLVWVWRDTPDASTNHDLSYAKSPDLVHWQSVSGRALTIPITLATGDVVDPVPAGGGIINNNTKIGFDAQNQPIIAYHKFDAAGNTQLYNARFENGRWTPHQASQWTYRWAFGGQGTLVFQIEVEEAKLQRNGDLTQTWYHVQYGGWGAFRLDPTTLAQTAIIDPPLPYPKALDQPESPTPGMVVRWAADSGHGPDPNVLYLLRWETLESNQDQPRAVIPPPTRLRLYAVRQP